MKKFIIILGVTLLGVADVTRVNEVVEDTLAGLQWQDTSANQSVQLGWGDAIRYCETLSLDGHDDWRLPNINELFSLVDYRRTAPAISEIFEHVATEYTSYWSSTTNARYQSDAYYAKAWLINFESGMQLVSDKSAKKYVRCVRSGRL